MASITKTQFMQILEQSIPDGNPNKALVLDAARDLVPGQDSDLQAVKKSYREYKRYHPERAGEEPTFQQVLEWTRSKFGQEEVGRLYELLLKIYNTLSELGEMNIDQKIPVPSEAILKMRMLAYQALYPGK